MPGVLKKLKITPFEDSTIGATVEGLDFSEPIPKEVSDDLLSALHTHGVLVARATNVDDDTMIALGKAWGPLDNIKAHKKAGRKFRLVSASYRRSLGQYSRMMFRRRMYRLRTG